MRIHDCRHSFAFHALTSGLDLYTLGLLFGHADIAATAIYGPLDDAALHDAAAQATGVIARAIGYPVTRPRDICAITEKPLCAGSLTLAKSRRNTSRFGSCPMPICALSCKCIETMDFGSLEIRVGI